MQFDQKKVRKKSCESEAAQWLKPVMCCNCIPNPCDLGNDKYTFTVQLQRLHMDMENLQEEKDTEISSTRDKLLSAQDEILLLHQAAAKAVSERDTDFMSLQEELKKVRAELEGWRKAASEYEEEIRSLQSTFQLRCQQCEVQQREEATRLQGKWTLKLKAPSYLLLFRE